MKRSSNFSRALLASLLIAIVVFGAGCNRLRKAEVKLKRRLETLFQKSPGNLHTVTISWTPSVSPNIGGYNIYRTTTIPPTTYFEKLTQQPVGGTQYSDSTALGGSRYSYYVTAVDSKGIESKASELTTVSIPYP